MAIYAPPLPLDRGPGAARVARRLPRAFERAILLLLRWQELARQRRALLRLDDHMLKDIGINRALALREADRPFWDEGREPWQSWQ